MQSEQDEPTTDWLEQQQAAAPEGKATDDEHGAQTGPPVQDRARPTDEADEADLIEQSQEVPDDEEDQ